MVTADTTLPGRSGAQYLTLALAFLALFLIPPFLAVSMSAEATTATLLVYLPAASVALGLVDAAWFRFTWSFPAIAAAIFWVSTLMMYNPGTWIYAVGVFVLCALGGAAGRALRGGAR
ncbi:hypothetical protein SAMN04488535_1177 [Corynebacterium mycetoides]|uniref:Uncharacterized protein n=1 Tax=Corynebacterium mycetoides TaxID=38302 RepID=A0A1G9NTY9_9CORY|nr:hypothetical protein [Corynebacterium mycetoides]SDL90058.1 hypothetical protein SAMN04488535_1177 [Corynebacterium mycetoides]